MRIGIDATALYGRYGGVQYALWNLLYALSRENNAHQYIVFVPSDGPPPRLRQMMNAQWQWRFLPFPGSARMQRILWQQTQLPALLQKENCDLLYAPTYVSPARISIPVVLTVYDLIALKHPQFATVANRMHYRLLMSPSLKGAARIAVPSEAVRLDINHYFGSSIAAKTHIVPLGLEPFFRQTIDVAEKEAVRRHYQLPQKYFLFIGNKEPKKNLSALIDAYLQLQARLPHAPPLVVAGGTRPWKNQHIPPHSHIHQTGYVRRRHLPALYAASMGFIFPTLAEGFGLPVLEALASGAPVITTRAVPICGVSKCVQMVNAHSAPQIAAAMEELLINPQLRKRAEEVGPQFAGTFTWQRTAREMLQLFTAAADAPQP